MKTTKINKPLNEDKQGFTLVELLIVVSIIAVLVAIAVPIFSSQLHKTNVATDWANVRSYYAEITTDFISTGKYNSKVKCYYDQGFDRFSITFLDGMNIKLKEGYFAVAYTEGEGYQIIYECNNGDNDCRLQLGDFS